MLLLILIFLFINTSELNAKPGCMDNSKHGDLCDGWDNKEYYFISCNCPCDQHPHSFDRDQCTKCLHYHIPNEDYKECD